MIFADLLCCWPASRGRRSEKEAAAAAAIADFDAPSSATSALCVFCNPTSDTFDIILEDDRFVVFADRSPAAAHHLLAVPRAHISNVKALRGSDGAQMIDDLRSIGQRALALVDRERLVNPFADDYQAAAAHNGALAPTTSASGPKEVRYGFHIHPFRSVDHLHLHCLALPFNSQLKALKYRVAPGSGSPDAPHKGWGWFVTAEQAAAILRDGGEVGVKPC